MHASSFDEMKRVLREHFADLWCGPRVRVLDVGSLRVDVGDQRTYWEAVSPDWRYVGCDIEPGPNVDLAMSDPYTLPVESGSVDALIC